MRVKVEVVRRREGVGIGAELAVDQILECAHAQWM